MRIDNLVIVLALSTAALAAPGPTDGPLPTDKSGLYAVQRLLGRSHGRVTPNIILVLAPNLDPARAAELTKVLEPAMAEAGIKSNLSKAAFLAQLAQESGAFKFKVELDSGTKYNGRADLGNTEPGDGPRFKGRGFIQLTGRSNYAKAGRELGLDLVNHPELAETDENAARVAAWYWRTRNINPPAEAGDFVKVTRLINGGTNGLSQREAFYAKAKQALGI